MLQFLCDGIYLLHTGCLTYGSHHGKLVNGKIQRYINGGKATDFRALWESEMKSELAHAVYKM